MSKLWIEIDNTRYENVSKITPSVVYDYYYNVQTMDGKKHRDVKGKRTNYDVVFFNNNLTEYEDIRRYLRSKETVMLKIPYGATTYVEGEFYITILGDTPKGKMITGSMYHTGLEVTFERVDYDAH